MTLPGFAAEASLHTTRAQYNGTARCSPATADVRPQARIESEDQCLRRASHIQSLYDRAGIAAAAHNYRALDLYMEMIDDNLNTYSRLC